MSASSESDCDVKPVSNCQPRTRRGLAKQSASDCQLSVDVSPSSENSIYTNQVFRLNSLAAKRVQQKELYKKPLSEDLKGKATEQESDEKSTVSSSNRSLIIDEASSPEVKDPTPPSTPKRVIASKGKRMKKGVKAAMNNLQKMKKTMSESNDDVMIIDNDPCQTTDGHSFAIKIRLPSGVKKFQMKPVESFARVFSSIAAAEDADENDILMFFNDSTVHIYDSPIALGITVADILDCHIHRSRDHSSPEPVEETVGAVGDRMLIRLHLQMKDSKSRTTLSIRKDEPMEKLMREFCRKARKDFGTLKFCFDGESVELSATPQSLDLETDYCIDVLKL